MPGLLLIACWCICGVLISGFQDKTVFDLDTNGIQSVEAVQVSDQAMVAVLLFHCSSKQIANIYIYN